VTGEGGMTPEWVYGQLRLIALAVLTLGFVLLLQGNGIDRLRKRSDQRFDDVTNLYRRVGDLEQWTIDARSRLDLSKSAPARPAKKTAAAKAAD
jgi:hypothetical protein